jgi:hypothetical protein
VCGWLEEAVAAGGMSSLGSMGKGTAEYRPVLPSRYRQPWTDD